MRLGRLIAGAGDVGRGWRATEEDARVAHNNQLNIEERNRLERLRRLQVQAQVGNLPDFGNLLSEGVQRGVTDVPFVGEVAGVAPGSVGLAVDSEKVGTESAPESAPESAHADAQRGPRREQLPSRWSRAANQLPDRFPNYQDNYYDHYYDENASAATNFGRATRNNIGAGLAAGLRVMDLAGNHPALGPLRMARDVVGFVGEHAGEIAEATGAAVGYEPSRREEATTEGPSRTTQAPTAGGERAPDTAPSVEDQANLAAKSNAAATAGIRSGARGAEDAPRYGQDHFYRADPQAVTRDMQNLMQDREQAVGIAQMYQQAGMGEQYTVARLAIAEMDQQMFQLHGERAIFELGRLADPRRLEAVWSHYAGVPMEIHPRSDGTYDVMVEGRVLPGAAALSVEELSDLAQRDFSESYREQVNEIQAERDRLLFASQLRTNEAIAGQRAQQIRELSVEELRQAGENMRAQMQDQGYDVSTISAEGFMTVTPPNGGEPMVVNVSDLFAPPEEGQIRGQNAVVRLPVNFGVAQRNAGIRPPNGQ